MPPTPDEVSAEEKRKGRNRKSVGIQISTKNLPGRDERRCWHLRGDYRRFVSTSPSYILHSLYTHSNANRKRAGKDKRRTSLQNLLQKLIYRKHLIQFPDQTLHGQGKKPIGSLVVISTGSWGTAITVLERTEKKPFLSLKIRLM